MNALLRLLCLTVLLGATGCDPNNSECERLCSRFVNDCGWTAWGSVDQCRIGCTEDLYRRSDASEVIACYDAAVDAPTAEQAAAVVDRAVEAGLFADAVAAGTFDRDAAVNDAVGHGTCDAFALVQCKVEAVKVRPDAPLVPGTANSY